MAPLNQQQIILTGLTSTVAPCTSATEYSFYVRHPGMYTITYEPAPQLHRVRSPVKCIIYISFCAIIGATFMFFFIFWLYVIYSERMDVKDAEEGQRVVTEKWKAVVKEVKEVDEKEREKEPLV